MNSITFSDKFVTEKGICGEREQVLENSLDHLLQALYALNHTYFPSRKRIEVYIQMFENKPGNCYDRLLRILELRLLVIP